MRLSRLSLAALPVAILAAGCAGTSPPTSAPADVREQAEIKARVLELQQRAAMAEVEIARLRQQVADLEARLHESQGGRGAAGRAPSGGSSLPPALPMTPSATVEEADLIPEQPAQPSTTAPPTAPAGEASTAGGQELTSAAQSIYDRGYTLYHQGRYVDAETSFQRFLQSYQRTELADNAQYWIGECRFARGDYRGALAAFQATVDLYPDGNKVPDALLKVGDCLRNLDDPTGARGRYDEVVRRFPGTAAAAMAEERRAQLP